MKKYSTKKKSKLVLFDTKGYAFSKMDLMLTIIGVLIIVSTVCVIHKLNTLYSILVAVTVLISIPFIISAYFTYKAEKKRFDEYCIYFEYMKLYYGVYNKIIIALKETNKQFSDGSKMKNCIEMAIKSIETTGDYRKALDIIDEQYHNTHLELLHSQMVNGEVQGVTGIVESMKLINYDSWREQTIMHQKQKNIARIYLYGFSVFAIAISVMPVIIFKTPEIADKLFIDPSYQLATFIELEGMFLVFIFAWIYLVNKKWIRSDE